jgi:hypothetical protein
MKIEVAMHIENLDGAPLKFARAKMFQIGISPS